MQSRRRTAAALALAATIGLAGCGSDESEQPREGVLVGDLTGDASGSFDLDEVEAGQEITLRAKVSEVLSPDSFVVPAEETAGDPLLVLAEDHDLAPGEVVQLGGILTVFSYDDQDDDHDLADEPAYAAYDGKLALVAQLNDDDLPLDDQ